MSNISKALNKKIKETIGYCPTINTSRQNKKKYIKCEYTPEQLIEIASLISSGEYNTFDITSDWDGSFFVLNKIETDEEYQERFSRENAVYQKWIFDKKEIIKNFKEEQEKNKAQKDSKFNDPEYIEYLRMKNKFEKM